MLQMGTRGSEFSLIKVQWTFFIFKMNLFIWMSR